jgi:hypothetical protein
MNKKQTLPLGTVILILICYFVGSWLGIIPGSKTSTNPSGGGSTPVASVPISSSPTSSGGATAGEPNWGHQKKTSNCSARGALPDPDCTPGDILNVTKNDICVSGYSASVRNVPDSEKNQDYDEYGITKRNPGQYEVDHFVSLELGGSNDISNLWPEPAEPKPGFHEKDKVENYLHDQVCSGALTLRQAQIKIATNWLDVYNSMPK